MDEAKSPEEEVKEVKAIDIIKTDVAAKISESGPTVKENVINVLAEIEIKRRTDLLVSAFKKREEIEKELKKYKEDDVTYDLDLKPLTKGFTKAVAEKYQKQKGELTKLINAVEKAVKENQYDQLSNLLGGKKEEAKAE